MDQLTPFQKAGLRILATIGIWPNIHFTYSPFKILEFRQLVESLNWTGTERVLDIGCGAGLQTFLIGRLAGHTTGLDINTEFIEQANWYARHVQNHGRVDFVSLHLKDIGWPDRIFDRIFSICVLEHIPEHVDILTECLRLLKPGGEMIFSVDTLAAIDDEDLRQSHSAQHHVVRYYSPEDLRDLLLGIGFEDVQLKGLFRSRMARQLFEQGIVEGFNFGRFSASRLAARLEEAELEAPDNAKEIFLAASARAPR